MHSSPTHTKPSCLRQYSTSLSASSMNWGLTTQAPTKRPSYFSTKRATSRLPATNSAGVPFSWQRWELMIPRSTPVLSR